MSSPDSPPTASATVPVAAAPRSKLRSLALPTFAVLTIIGVLAALIIPTVGRCRCTAPRSADGSNLRQIGQAALIFTSEHRDKFPQVDDIHAFATALAKDGGLDDATIWIVSTERGTSHATRVSTVLTPDRTATAPTFAAIRPSFAAVVRGLRIDLPPQTPIAWTRGLQPDGTWSKDSPYGGDGGHIVFLGGNVTFYRKLTLKDSPFLDHDGRPTVDLRASLPPDARIANN